MSISSMSPTMTRKVLAGVVAFLLVSLAIVRTSDAAFSAQTISGDIAFSTGEIGLDADVTTALFNESNLIPGDEVANCVLITYDGSVASDDLTAVDLAVDPGNNADLLDHLEVAMAIADDCDEVTPAYGTAGGLADLAGTTGWTPDAPTESRGFFIQVTVGVGAPQGATAEDIALTWSLETTG